MTDSKNKLRLVQTCGACPEQYDVFKGEELVGYMRLRNGWFYANCRGERVYEAHPRGDGIFEDEERDKYLNTACRAINEALDVEPEEEKLFVIEYGGCGDE